MGCSTESYTYGGRCRSYAELIRESGRG